MSILSTPLTSPFSRPLLIYDDRCLLCIQFAVWAKRFSGGWIRLAGHYYSPEAMEVKRSIFPADYDSTQMFWLINKNGAYGARFGLIELFKEILRGLIKTRIGNNPFKDGEDSVFVENEDSTLCNDNTCSNLAGSNCASFWDTWSRIATMLRNSAKYCHHDQHGK